MELHTQDSDLHIGYTNKLSILLIIFSAVFHWMQGVSADVVYIWFFRTLSSVSVILIIVLNLIRLVDWYKTRKTK